LPLVTRKISENQTLGTSNLEKAEQELDSDKFVPKAAPRKISKQDLILHLDAFHPSSFKVPKLQKHCLFEVLLPCPHFNPSVCKKNSSAQNVNPEISLAMGPWQKPNNLKTT
jgi:hypothetical protein